MEYLYDDCGVKCRKNPKDETDIEPVEPYCLNCGSPTEECDCDDYEEGWYIDEEEEEEEEAKEEAERELMGLEDVNVE